MTTVTLVYPYFQPSNDNSIFRFPPLGLGYIATYLKRESISVDLVDCTFLNQKEAVERVRRSKPKIIGIQSMFSLKSKAMEFASLFRDDCELLVAGGPQPTSDPEEFLRHFDVAVIGEGEQTMLELVTEAEGSLNLSKVEGIAYKQSIDGKTRFTPPRRFIQNLDNIPFPSRELFDNEAYKRYYSKNFGYTTTSVMTSRGCPFQCGFCSRPVFGNEFRSRSASNIVDEMEHVAALGYGRAWFADDCFTLGRKRLLRICEEIIERRVKVGWECLSRVDTMDNEVAGKMRKAGCVRVFFGIESGNNRILAMMKKNATVEQAKKAVEVTKLSEIQVGAFFIVGYPGEDSATLLDTVNFASKLPLDYLSFTMPYPIPGTPLHEMVKDKITVEEWEEPKSLRLIKHNLLFQSSLSEAKLKFAIIKGMAQFYIRKYLRRPGYGLVGHPFESLTDYLLTQMR
jgi:anaerobic magnesium-protoporphyrin IX monomethyl ester cyclase